MYIKPADRSYILNTNMLRISLKTSTKIDKKGGGVLRKVFININIKNILKLRNIKEQVGKYKRDGR